MPTDNHQLNVPEEGAADWHIPLNENFNTLDSILSNISTDGQTFSPSNLVTDEITLNGDTRTNWPSGAVGRDTTYLIHESGGTYYAESETFQSYSGTDASNVIQSAADELDGTKTGYDSNDTAERPGGGEIRIARGNYVLNSTVTLRSGVALIGAQPTWLLGRTNHEYEYCVLTAGSGLADGTPMVQTEPDRNHIAVRNLAFNGASRPVYGLKIQDGSGTSMVSNVHITRCRRPGYWTRGSLDTWVHMTSVKDCGNSTTPAVLVESANDSIGGGSNDTQIRWYGGRISNDNGYSALVFNSSLGRWYDCTIKSSAAPATTPMPVIDHDGSMLELSRCTIDGYRGSGAYGISQSQNNQLRVADTLIEKADVGIALSGNSDTSLDSVRIRDMIAAGISVTGRPGQWDRVDIQDVQQDGIVFDGAQCFSQFSNVRINNWDSDGDGTGVAVDVRGIKGGQPGDVPMFNGLAIGAGDYVSNVNNPQLCIVDGEWVVPYTYSLGGTNGSVSVSEKPTNPTSIRVDAGSQSANLRGIDGRTVPGSIVVVERTGSNAVTLEHDYGSATNPLLNRSGANETLASAGAVAAYRYDSQTGAWREVWSNLA